MNNILLVGAGPMAKAYGHVLNDLEVAYEVVGRGETSALDFEKECGKKVNVGGISKWLSAQKGSLVDGTAIVATPVESLKDNCVALMEHGYKNILVEKPGGLEHGEIHDLSELAERTNSNIFVAYNRRYFASVLKAKELIVEDGGVTSFNFEFTEWGHIIANLNKPKQVFENWFLANSSHVVDLAFYLGGLPVEMHAYTAGSLDWHSAASKFAGCGRTETGALFNYQANWDAPGRWALEIMTTQHRLIFKPMESLQIQKKGSIAIVPVELNYEKDKLFKPGLYEQTKSFIIRDHDGMIDIHQQLKMAQNVYAKMLNN